MGKVNPLWGAVSFYLKRWKFELSLKITWIKYVTQSKCDVWNFKNCHISALEFQFAKTFGGSVKGYRKNLFLGHVSYNNSTWLSLNSRK